MFLRRRNAVTAITKNVFESNVAEQNMVENDIFSNFLYCLFNCWANVWQFINKKFLLFAKYTKYCIPSRVTPSNKQHSRNHTPESLARTHAQNTNRRETDAEKQKMTNGAICLAFYQFLSDNERIKCLKYKSIRRPSNDGVINKFWFFDRPE